MFNKFISRQYISELGKYFKNADAEAPEYEPSSSIVILFFF